LKISNYRKILREKIEFVYYIFNVFLIAAKCILLNNSASFQYFSFKLGQIVELVQCFHMETNKKILGKINPQRCSVTLIILASRMYFYTFTRTNPETFVYRGQNTSLRT
jgi:hypothetical protein